MGPQGQTFLCVLILLLLADKTTPHLLTGSSHVTTVLPSPPARVVPSPTPLTSQGDFFQGPKSSCALLPSRHSSLTHGAGLALESKMLCLCGGDVGRVPSFSNMEGGENNGLVTAVGLNTVVLFSPITNSHPLRNRVVLLPFATLLGFGGINLPAPVPCLFAQALTVSM